jgi:hyperosmotically inducible protein
MRTIAVLFCAYALVACASSKSAEPPIENPNEYREPIDNPNEVDSPMSEESVRQNGDPSPDADLDGHRDDAKRADRDVDRDVEDKNEPVAADNTGVNDRDEEPGALTPADQGEGDSDLEITQNIRKAVMDDDSLSFTAKNVKIITQDGKVTLRGPVKSAQERTAIGVAAKKFAAGRVDNQLEVAN